MISRKRRQGPETRRRPPSRQAPAELPAAAPHSAARSLSEYELQELREAGALTERQVDELLAADATEQHLDELLNGDPEPEITIGTLHHQAPGVRVDRDSAPAPRLTIELVPSTCWYSNVRSEASQADWNVIRRAAYRAAGYRCEVCGRRGPQHPVECHESWHYDERQLVQRLERMIALCPACHQVKHLGHANTTAHGPQARAHLADVNGWSPQQTDRYIAEAFATWQRRSRNEWQLDITALADYGVGTAASGGEREIMG
jgi:5-methylcytosine-specific restriction endonuclease McrA